MTFAEIFLKDLIFVCPILFVGSGLIAFTIEALILRGDQWKWLAGPMDRDGDERRIGHSGNWWLLIEKRLKSILVMCVVQALFLAAGVTSGTTPNPF